VLSFAAYLAEVSVLFVEAYSAILTIPQVPLYPMTTLLSHSHSSLGNPRTTASDLAWMYRERASIALLLPNISFRFLTSQS
jgi:hypothetical protein